MRCFSRPRDIACRKGRPRNIRPSARRKRFFCCRGVGADVSNVRANELISSLRESLTSYRLSSSAAAKLRGRLGFAQSLLFSRLARATLHPYARRQYSSLRKQPSFPAKLRFATNWRARSISENAPRCVPYATPSPVVAYSDAFGAGRNGVLVAEQDKHFATETHFPPWFSAHEDCAVTEFEMLASLRPSSAISTYFTAAPYYFLSPIRPRSRVSRTAPASLRTRGKSRPRCGASPPCVPYFSGPSGAQQICTVPTRNRDVAAAEPFPTC